MSITSAAIITKARQVTKRTNETDLPDSDIETLIAEAVREISKRTLCLKSSTTGTLSASTNTISKPSDMVDSSAAIDELYLDETLLDPCTFKEWRAGKMDSCYAYRNGTIYVLPSPDSDKSYTLYYSSYHGSTITTLEFNDDMKKAVEHLVCKKIYENYEQEDKVLIQEARYEAEIAKFVPDEPAVQTKRSNFRE